MAANRQMQVSMILTAYDRASRVINSFATKNEARLMSFSKKTGEMGDKAFKTGKEFGAIGLAAAGPLGLAIKAAADYEKLNISLKTSFQGNAMAASKAFKQINAFAAQTPYELEEVMTGFIKLKNMGLEPGQKALTAYGNIASGMGKSLNDMVEAVADAATFEFERLKEFGIKASQQGNKVTFLFQGVKTTVNKNAKEIEKYLQNVGNTKFAGGIEAQSKSIYGQFSTLKDNANQVAVMFGRTLMPGLNQLFAKMSVIIAKVQTWTEKNPKLAKNIMMIVVGVAALSLGISGLSFVFGGLMKAMSFASGAGGVFLKLLKATTYQNAALGIQMKLATIAAYGSAIATKVAAVATGFMSGAMTVLNAIMAINPFVLLAMAVIGIATLIYKYWDNIKAFFVKTWARIKEMFNNAVAFIKKWGLLFVNPVAFIIQHWDKIKAYFMELWPKIKAQFTGFVDNIKEIPGKMFDAGKNIVKSIWEGIKSFASRPVEAIKDIVKKIRDFLPFSPAKTGPLRDIHRVRLVETIAENMKPNAMVKAMRTTTAAAILSMNVAAAQPNGAFSRPAPNINARVGGGPQISIIFNPTIYMGGSPVTGGAADDLKKQLASMKDELKNLVLEAIRKDARRNY
jgi:hypothetical protein